MGTMTLDAKSPIPFGLALGAGAWGVVVIAASTSGALGALAEEFMPAYAGLLGLGIMAPIALYCRVPAVRRAVDSIGLRRLTLLHIWRIPAGMLFLHQGDSGGLPMLFAMLAGFGDIFAGLLAASLIGREPTSEWLWFVHVFGCAELIAAVGTGLIFALLGDPLMATLTTLPMALIPLFGVGLSAASHVVAFHALRRP